MKPVVSICCVTYNQEEYIENTLESFLMQRTNFPFEILIYDNASQDQTPAIIQRYQRMYPGLIKPIFQTEKQSSQELYLDYVHNVARASGDYLAYCKGDDYWTDPCKLQKQVDIMEQNPEFSACIHADKTINESGEKITSCRQPYTENYPLSMEELIQLNGGFVRNSMLCRNDCLKQSVLPSWYFHFSTSDYPMLLWAGLQGSVYYLNEIMSVYRQLNAGNQISAEEYVGLCKLLRDFDNDTNHQYSETIQEEILYHGFSFYLSDKNLKVLKTSTYQTCYQSLHFLQKINLHVSHYVPMTVTIKKWLKKSGKLYLFKPNEIFPLEK